MKSTTDHSVAAPVSRKILSLAKQGTIATVAALAKEKGRSAFRAVVRHDEPHRYPRYTVWLCAPERVMRPQLAVLLDWSRSGSILPLAVPAYAHELRRAQGSLRTSREFLWLVLYPERRITGSDFEEVLTLIRLASRSASPTADEKLVVAILECRLLHAMEPSRIASQMGLQLSLIHQVLRSAYQVLRRANLPHNPLSGHRIGPEMWGAFRLHWDAELQTYGAEAVGLDRRAVEPSVREIFRPIAQSGTDALDGLVGVEDEHTIDETLASEIFDLEL